MLTETTPLAVAIAHTRLDDRHSQCKPHANTGSSHMIAAVGLFVGFSREGQKSREELIIRKLDPKRTAHQEITQTTNNTQDSVPTGTPPSSCYVTTNLSS
mmetsp:Transcript_3151/g.4258  ORF Transcript_3151/g.4258 Transcript_3151/m.4258 type:complete len:100 (-) Transcript_3151:91-390(-)